MTLQINAINVNRTEKDSIKNINNQLVNHDKDTQNTLNNKSNISEKNDSANLSKESTRTSSPVIAQINIEGLDNNTELENNSEHNSSSETVNSVSNNNAEINENFSGNYDQKMISELKSILANVTDDKLKNKIMDKLEHLENKLDKKGDVGAKDWRNVMNLVKDISVDNLSPNTDLEQFNNFKHDLRVWNSINDGSNAKILLKRNYDNADDKINKYESTRNQVINKINSMGLSNEQASELIKMIPATNNILKDNGSKVFDMALTMLNNIDNAVSSSKSTDLKNPQIFNSLKSEIEHCATMGIQIDAKANQMKEAGREQVRDFGSFFNRVFNSNASVVTDSKKREVADKSVKLATAMDKILSLNSGKDLNEMKNLRSQLEGYVDLISSKESNSFSSKKLAGLEDLCQKITEKFGVGLSENDKNLLNEISQTSVDLRNAKVTMSKTNQQVTQKISNLQKTIGEFKTSVLELSPKEMAVVKPATEVLMVASKLMDDSLNDNNPYLAMAAQDTMEKYMSELKNFKNLSMKEPKDEKALQDSLNRMKEISTSFTNLMSKIDTLKKDGLTAQESNEILSDIEKLVGKEKLEICDAQAYANQMDKENDSPDLAPNSSENRPISDRATIFSKSIENSRFDFSSARVQVAKAIKEMDDPRFIDKLSSTFKSNPNFGSKIDNIVNQFSDLRTSQNELLNNYKQVNSFQKKLEELLLSDSFKNVINNIKKDESNLDDKYINELVNTYIEEANTLENMLNLEIKVEDDPMVSLLESFRKIITTLDLDTRKLNTDKANAKSIDQYFMTSSKEQRESREKSDSINKEFVQSMLELSERYLVSANKIDKLALKHQVTGNLA